MSRPLALLLAVALILIAPAAVLSWQLSNGLRRELHAQDAAVLVLAGPVGIATGRAARLSFRVTGARAEGAAPVHEIRATLRGVRIDPRQALRGRLVVRRIQSGSASVVLAAVDLERYLAAEKDIRGAKVRMDDGTVTITGTVTVLNSSLEVEMRARLEIASGRHIVLRVLSLNVSGVALPPDLGNALATAVNPLVTAPREPVPLRFTGVAVGRGRAVITGEPAP